MTTQKLAADYAWGRPRPKHLLAAGFKLVCRYLSHTGSKNLTATERTALLKAGEDIVVVWESTAGRATQGRAAGVEDAKAAVAQLKALKGPKGMAVYFAVDGDFSPAAVRAYFAGVQAIVKAAGYRVGGYGSRRVVNYLVHEGLIDVVWQTAAWSLGKVSTHADLYQRAQTRRIDGVTVDVDVICHSDYGGWQGALAKGSTHRRAHERKKAAAPKTTAAQRRRRRSIREHVVTARRAVAAFFRARVGRQIAHDLAIAAGAAVAVIYGAHTVDAGVLEAAGVAGVHALMRLLLPVPPADGQRRRRTARR